MYSQKQLKERAMMKIVALLFKWGWRKTYYYVLAKPH